MRIAAGSKQNKCETEKGLGHFLSSDCSEELVCDLIVNLTLHSDSGIAVRLDSVFTKFDFLRNLRVWRQKN